jgi:hypothetical protein
MTSQGPALSGVSGAERSKPPAVARAISLLWIALVLGTPYWLLLQAEGVTPHSRDAIAVVVGLLVTIYLVDRVEVGHNWARFVLAAVLIAVLVHDATTVAALLKQMPSSKIDLSGAGSLATVQYLLKAVPTMAVMGITQCGLVAYALYLIFTAAATSWFKSPKIVAVAVAGVA